VVTLDRDGTNDVVISEDGDIPFQPIWAPDSESIAFANRSADPAFIVADAMGGEDMRLSVSLPPFYFYWSPSGNELGALRNRSTGGLVHERFQIADELTVVEVDGGAPYYFSWNPAGDGTVAHVGADRLDTVATDGATEALDVVPGVFQAPQWTAQGIVAAVRDDDEQRIVRIQDGTVEHLVEAGGSVIFGVSDSGRYLAVQSFDAATNSVSVALVDEPVAPNRLQVVDLESGDLTSVTEGPAVGFFWSPTLDRLLIIEAEGQVGNLALSVWDNGEVRSGPSFTVAPQWFSEFLPFYDQYAQSMSLWSPDASAYAFIGAYESERGIFIANVDDGSVTRLADGSWVAWSPS
jgi:hypothetical protein